MLICLSQSRISVLAGLFAICRKINNDIGIDVSVPSHESAPSPKLVKYYHVVVISSLPHFKTAVHSEDAVVQFMVSPEEGNKCIYYLQVTYTCSC